MLAETLYAWTKTPHHCTMFQYNVSWSIICLDKNIPSLYNVPVQCQLKHYILGQKQPITAQCCSTMLVETLYAWTKTAHHCTIFQCNGSWNIICLYKNSPSLYNVSVQCWEKHYMLGQKQPITVQCFSTMLVEILYAWTKTAHHCTMFQYNVSWKIICSDQNSPSLYNVSVQC